MPVLLVLDTFEVMQYRSSAYVDGLQLFLDQLRGQIDRLRVVVVGRAEVPGFPVDSSPIEPDKFDAEAAVGFLATNGIADTATALAIMKRVTGNPLSLRLALEVFRLEGQRNYEAEITRHRSTARGPSPGRRRTPARTLRAR